MAANPDTLPGLALLKTVRLSPEASPEAVPAPAIGIRLRALAIGAFLTLLGSLAQVLAAQFQPRGGSFVSGNTALLEVAVLSLGLPVLANRLLKQRWPTLAFRPSELVAVYGMVAAGAAFSAYDCMQFVIPTLLYPFHFASVEPGLQRLQQHLPTWLGPHDGSVIEPYYLGGASFFRPEFLRAWLGPLVVWLLFAGCLALVMVSASVLVRRQWVENEHLTFPSLQLPLTLVKEERKGALAGWLPAIGLLAPFALRGSQFAQNFLPSLPSLPLSADLGQYLTNRPWNGLQPFPATIRPIDLGICYFIPLDVGLSAWLFYLLLKLLQVPGFALGWRHWGDDFDGFPEWRQQAIGAWIALFLVLLWSGRRHFGRALGAAFRSGSPVVRVDRAERWAARGLLVGLLAMVLGNWWAGMSLWATLAYLGAFLVLQVIMTRIRAQIGPPILEVFLVEPMAMIVRLAGSRNLNPGSLTLMSFYYWFTQNNRAQPMAHHLDTFRLAGETRTGTFAIAAVLVTGGILGAFVCLVAFLILGYRYGQGNFPGPALRNYAAQASFRPLALMLDNPRGPDWSALPGVATGAGLVVLLATLQRLVTGFPLNPVGYALALSGALLYNWPAFLLMWIVKGAILRYGGLKFYRSLIPLFLGMILGDILAQFVFGLAAWGVAE